jgi:endo-1,4-beta-xylanase
MKVTSIAAVTLLAASTLLSAGLSASSADSVDAAGAERGGVSVDSPLRDLAQRNDLRIGTAVDFDAYTNDATYRTRIGTEFSSITAENVMKWALVEPTRGTLDFAAADQLVAAAQANHQGVRGHTLLWHNQLPTWLTDGVTAGTITKDQLRDILHKHVTDEVTHFRGKLYQWDVANEVIDDNAQLRSTIWLQNLGPGYIADVFRWAHAADPKVKLYINDYNIEAGNAKSDAYFALVKDLLKQHVPIDGVGVQGHLGVQFGFNTAGQVAANLKRFQDLGLETSVTEADVRMVMPSDTVKLQAQAQGYSVLMQGCLLTRRCTSFTVWGYTDKYSWVPGFFTGQGAANLLDENFAAKPAYQELQGVLALAGRR